MVLSILLKRFQKFLSQNNFLGNQINSESNAEIYGKLLRKGVRCLEIDLWDGDDGLPKVTHGHTLCGNIKLSEVLKVIAKNVGELETENQFPVILSLEDHCSIEVCSHLLIMWSIYLYAEKRILIHF